MRRPTLIPMMSKVVFEELIYSACDEVRYTEVEMYQIIRWIYTEAVALSYTVVL